MFNILKPLMIKIVSAILLLSSPFAFAATTATPIQNTSQAIHFFENEMNYKINPYGVKKLLDEKATNITIVDVRSAKDYAAGHIPGAINLPPEKYNGFHGNEKSFPGLRKDGYNIVYCYELLCDLAKEAAVKFASVGYPVKEMAGGFKSWQEKEMPIER